MKNKMLEMEGLFDVLLEESVLGCVLIEKNAVDRVMDYLTEDSFSQVKNKAVWGAVIGLTKKGQPVDLRTVVTYLRETGNLKDVGGAADVADLTNKVASTVNLENYALKLKEYDMRRKLCAFGQIVQGNASNLGVEVFDLIDQAEAGLEKAVSIAASDQTLTAKDASKLALDNVHRAMSVKGYSGIKIGISCVDELLRGLTGGEVVVLAGRPGMGKTAFATTISLRMALNGIPCGFFSLEQTVEQLAQRQLSNLSGIYHEYLLDGTLKESQYERYLGAKTLYDTLPIYFDATSTLSIYQLKSKARRMKRKYGIQYLVIDYLQLMRSGEKGGNRESEVAAISGGLKALAKDLDIPIIILAQLSRQVEQRPDKKPMLSDLRESGAIEQDADKVVFLYRPEYYGFMEAQGGQSTKGICMVILAKNRHGSIGEVPAGFNGGLFRFYDLDEPSQPIYEEPTLENMPF